MKWKDPAVCPASYVLPGAGGQAPHHQLGGPVLVHYLHQHRAAHPGLVRYQGLSSLKRSVWLFGIPSNEAMDFSRKSYLMMVILSYFQLSTTDSQYI